MSRNILLNTARFNGVGLHTGKMLEVAIHPAEKGSGIKFKRTDLFPEVVIPADAQNVINTNRSTTIGNGDVYISTVEHILSALCGLKVDNALIEVTGPEMPILDGSAKQFVSALIEAGLAKDDSEHEYIVIEEPIFLKHEESGAEIIALPGDHYELNVMIDFANTQLEEQSANFDENGDNYQNEIASCRTFVFTNELHDLLASGLIKGGDISNAIVLAEPGLTQSKIDNLASEFGVAYEKYNGGPVLNPDKLRFPNEMARHKLLDLMGDLSLAGKPIKGQIIAIKPGHKLNTEFAMLLKKKALEQRKLKGKPHYNPDLEPILDAVGIQKMLPHRFPFLLVDKIIEQNPSMVVGIKNITFNEQLFQGHFPGNPVFPGVLQMEALAQTGGILALSTVEEPWKWDTYFLKMENVKFKAKVVPGDTLILKMQLLSPIRRGIVHMQGTAYVGNKIVSEGELTAQIIKRPE